ncbi:hypothetical protein [Clostridium estertheticum]|uniref:hypothetical protein n=1 Tax=Clostridium estertheticum TaxID=238834 RepID=UPI001CF543E4|nr:hypothetical protein [Clostridium estertheticum]MCB2360165.1 hypothetical protein [Clostridium estertheticum]
MSEKIEIAIWKDKIITAQEYSKDVHKKVYCPFCNPPVQMNCVLNSFFRAMPGIGRHNCGKVQPIYLDADWEGRRLVEKIRDSIGNLNIIIDINKMKYISNNYKKNDGEYSEKLNTNSKKGVYYRYDEYKDVFRDVIRTVVHMKQLIEKNTYEQLNTLIFKFKIENEELKINDILKLSYELDLSISGKARFAILKVDNVGKNKLKNEIYVNGYGVNGVFVTVSLKYQGSIEQIKVKKDDYVLAFGKIVYSEKFNKYFLNVASDANIKKLKENDVMEYFEGRELESYKITNTDNKIKFETKIQPKSKDIIVVKKDSSNNNIELEKNKYKPREYNYNRDNETHGNEIINQAIVPSSKKEKESLKQNFLKKLIKKICFLKN